MPDRRQQLLSQLSAYLDDELSPPERAQVEALLAKDADARQLLSELRATAEALRTLPRARAGDDLMDKLRARLEREALLGESTPAAAGETRGGVFRSGKLIAVAAVIALSFAAAYMMWPQGRQAALKQFALNTSERKAKTEEGAIEESAAPKIPSDEQARGFADKEFKTKITPAATPAAKTVAPSESPARQFAAGEAAKTAQDVPAQSAAPRPAAEEIAARVLSEEKVPPKPESLRAETDARNRAVEGYDGVTSPAPTAAPASPAVAAAPPPAPPPAENKTEAPPVVADAVGRDKARVIEGPPLPPDLQAGLAGLAAHDDLKAAAPAEPGSQLAANTPRESMGTFFSTAPSQQLEYDADQAAPPQMAVSTAEDGAVTVVDLAYATPQDQQQAVASIASQYAAQRLTEVRSLSFGDAATTRQAGQLETVQTQPALALCEKDAPTQDSSIQPAKPSESPADPLVATAYEVVVPDESARKQIVANLAKSAGSVVHEPAPAAPVTMGAAMGGAAALRGPAGTADRGDMSPSPASAQLEALDRAGGKIEAMQTSSADSARQQVFFDTSATSQAAPARRQIQPYAARATRAQVPHPQFGRQQIMTASRPVGQAGAGQSTLRLYLRVQPDHASRMQQLPARPMQPPPAGPNAPRP